MNAGSGRVLRIGIIAGEMSGDQLGGGLMQAMHQQAAAGDLQVEFIGIGGDNMQRAGLKPLAPLSDLSVNGFVEPLLALPRLLRLLRMVERACLDERVDAFIGIDFNVFNLLIERRLKRRGITTIHYVSPSVYAWRRNRARRMARSTDLLLALYPFEPAFYDGLPIRVVCVGHPLAQGIPADAGSPAARAAARRELGIDDAARVIALLPGSRRGEVRLMAGRFFAAAVLINESQPTTFVLPCVRPELQAVLDAELAPFASLQLVRYDGNARKALAACDGALVKSGTGTLEATCIGRPMVVSYRMGPMSYQLAKRLIRTPFVALPNILAGRAVVPELLQDDASPERLAETLLAQISGVNQGSALLDQFRELRNALVIGEGADMEAARAVLTFLDERRS